MVRHRVVGGSFVSAHDPRLHFGLGPVDSVDSVTVLWPDGSESVERDVAVDQILGIEFDLPDAIPSLTPRASGKF